MNLYHKREFLNNEKSESNSFISCSVDVVGTPEYSIIITDCYEKIRLHEEIENENALFKIDVLISNLTKLRQHIEETQILQKICSKRYKTKLLAETALSEIIENPLLANIRHQLQIFPSGKSFIIKRNFEKKNLQKIFNTKQS